MIWILANWKLLLTGAVVAALAVALMLAQADARHWKARQIATQSAFDTTVQNYRLAAETAAKLDAENVVRVKSEQAAITERTEHAYQAKLADSASRYDRLRASAAAYSSRPANPSVPDTSDATCLAYAAATCDAIPALLNEAQRNTDQLVALQGWVAGQMAVAP